MSPTHAVPETTSRGCGCGGGGGCSGGAKCTCPDPCGDCAPGTFERPRFFAGQLLTEEDLQLLTRYVTDKSRLHNRYLHGAGVVCGLEVTCDPCGGGHVRLHPGYALDCCGNDLVVPCAVDLDVNAMVRRLRLDRLGGHDCGDPCDDEARRAARQATGPPNRLQAERLQDERRSRRYCLYLEYCEEAAEPVAPYDDGGSCNGSRCQPSRLREGYRLTLRCPPGEHEPDDLLHRLRACFDDLGRAERTIGDAQAHDQMGWRTAQALAAARGEREISFASADREALDAALPLVEELARPAEDGEAVAEIDEAAARQRLDALFTVASRVTAFRLLGDAEREKVIGEDPELAERIGSAAEVVAAAAPQAPALARKLSTSRDRLIAEEVGKEALRWTSAEIEADAPPPREMVVFAHGAVDTARYKSQARGDLSNIRDWLLDRLDAPAADCRLRSEVLAIRLPAEENAVSSSFAESSRRLLEALFRYLLDCVCAALHPPCPPCDDPAVLLACLEVEDCEVTEICSLERTWVLTPNALRYWVPLFDGLGKLLEAFCCDLRRRIKLPRETKVPAAEEADGTLPGTALPSMTVATPPPQVQLFTATRPLSAAIEPPRLASLLTATGLPEGTVRSFTNVVGSVGGIATDSRLATRLADTPIAGVLRPGAAALFAGRGSARGATFDLAESDVREALVEVVDERMARAAERPEMREAIAAALTPELVGRVEERITEATRPAEEKASEAASAIGRIDRLMKTRLTATSLRDTKVVKDLRSTNSELKQNVKALEKSNAELLARLERLEAAGGGS